MSATTKPLDYAAAIADIDARINQLAGKREILVALRDMGAVIEVPEQAPAETPTPASATAGQAA